MRLDDLETITVGALAYVLLGAVWVFGILDTGALDRRQAAKWVALALLGLLHVVVGAALGSWLVLAFPSGLLLLAALAGYPDTPHETPPLWFWQGLLSPFLLSLLALGASPRLRVDRLRTPRKS
jgi:hypothetical protein